jgi:uncharacterized protein
MSDQVARIAASPSPKGWAREGSPFHAGERAVQDRVGVRDRAEQFGRRAIRDFMPDQHRDFFAQLPFLILGSLDAQRRPWGTMLVGQPGFAKSPDPRTLEIGARPILGYPASAALAVGASVGLLGIQLDTRRRNRMNGTIKRLDDRGFVVRVGQSFGNCSQYIQAREPQFIEPLEGAPSPRPETEGARLSATATGLIARSDTFFIATAAPGAGGDDPVEGVDISHRGGKPGFVRIAEEDGRTAITWPEFPGNRYFNTLGNLAINPMAGLLFVDFASGGLLALTGEAEVIWSGPELTAFPGAERFVRFRAVAGTWLDEAVPLRWSAPVQAPQLAATGTWQDVEAAIAGRRVD